MERVWNEREYWVEMNRYDLFFGLEGLERGKESLVGAEGLEGKKGEEICLEFLGV